MVAIIVPGRFGPMVVGGTSGGGGNSAAYTNFIARTSGLDATHLSAYAGLLNGLTTDGLFNSDGTSSFFDALYVCATQDVTTAKLNLVTGTYNMTNAAGTPTFAADQGFTGDGANYLTTSFNPSTASTPKFVQNSAVLGVWGYDSVSGQAAAPIGNRDGSAGSDHLLIRYTDNKWYSRLNTNVFNGAGISNTGTTGLFVTDRSGSAGITAYQNGSSFGTETDSSAAPYNGNITLITVSGISASWSGKISAAVIGASLGGTNQSNFYSRMRTYMTAVGVP